MNHLELQLSSPDNLVDLFRETYNCNTTLFQIQLIVKTQPNKIHVVP